MTDERDQSSRGKESLERVTARDVPLVRGAGSESEPAPRAQRPAQLPRDPTYEAELAQVELAVLRDPERRDDPSTKQGGGRRAHEYAPGQPPESVTPESPGTRGSHEVALGRSPEPPSSGGRAVASGTLLSVGAVDPRGKTERTLETPRMFFSRPDEGAEAYFKPGKIPAVTVHQTLETETVKLSDSVDPRRAKTIPRLDRADLARLAALQAEPDSEAPVARSDPPSSLDLPASDASPRWNQQDYDPASSLGPRAHDGQIHASLSAFRDQGEPSFSLDGVSTRPEPFVQRRASEPPVSVQAPDTSMIPTHRDLPVHRIEASRPPPAPANASESAPRARLDSAAPFSEVAGPTTASIAAEEPERRAPWLNYAAFGLALLFALALGLWLTSGKAPQQAAPNPPSTTPVVKPIDPALAPARPALPATADAVVAPAVPVAPTPQLAPTPAAPRLTPTPASPRKEPVTSSPKATAPSNPPAASEPTAPRKSAPSKSSHETIF